MLYVGTYSKRDSEGIYGLDFDPATGALTNREALAGLRNPSFLALHPTRQWLYSVCEEEQDGAVAALILDKTQRCSVLSMQSSGGANPCHLAVDPTGRWLVTANYNSGSVALHPINQDGSLSPAADLAQHSGSGPLSDRQEGPHAHSANFDPTGRFVIAADLGIDRLMVYALDMTQGQLILHQEVEVQPGAGPRHLTFDLQGRYAYLINELDNTIIVYRWNAATNTLIQLQTISTLPAEFTGTSYCADVHFHPSGAYLYGSNRGHDSLAIFRVEQTSGLLEAAGHVSTGGEHPRNFTVTTDGQWVLVANQDTDNIVVFAVSEGGARLEPRGQISLPAPTCLLFD